MSTALELRGVGKDYDMGAVGTLRVLRDVNLAIAPGEHVAVVGPSGSGKSTMLSIMGTLDRPTSGEVLIGGQPTQLMGDAERSQLRGRELGFVFQQFFLLPTVDALENVSLGMLYSGIPPAERARRSADALDRVGLGARMRHRPGQLSGGEQQRVAVARAIAHDPAIVFADEPTGSLDQETGTQIMATLRAITGAAVIVITHDDAIAAQFPRRVHIRDGRIVRERE